MLLGIPNSSDISDPRKHIMAKFIGIKRKNLSLFQSNSIQLQSVVSLITSWKDTIQAIPSTKKKRKKGERENEKKEKEREEVEKRRRRKRDGKSLCGRKGKRGE